MKLVGVLALSLAACCFAVPGAMADNPVSSKGPAFGIDMTNTTSTGSRQGTGNPSSGGEPLSLGVYDPHNRFQSSNGPDIEHVFVYWQALDKGMLSRKMRLARDKGRVLMVTVEPYTRAANWRDGSERLFEDIVAGRFDAEIAASCGVIAEFPGEKWVRWGHEMEDPTGRYPWARSDPRGYVAAYRKFVDTCRKFAPQARFIWSPKGNRGLEAYYPGNAHVDMVGLSVWGLEKWDRDSYGRPRGFAETLRGKYRRVERFGKPVIIAELGVAGRDVYRQAWISEILATPARRAPFPLLMGIVYFNDKEPHYWPNGYGSPDWRVSASAFAKDRPLAMSSR